MKLNLIGMWRGSGTGGSPAHYATDRGSYIIQGYRLDADATGQLTGCAPHETAVEIPGDMYDQIGEHWARARNLL